MSTFTDDEFEALVAFYRDRWRQPRWRHILELDDEAFEAKLREAAATLEQDSAATAGHRALVLALRQERRAHAGIESSSSSCSASSGSSRWHR